MTLQEHYNAIKNGKGNKAQFLKQAKYLFPQYINQYSDFDSATNVLKSKQIISEAAGGVISKGFDIWDWKKILAEEAKAEEKNTSKEVTDKQAHAYDNKDMKNADNINFNEIMKGFYCELRDKKNAGKTGDELKDMVVKNLAKDPLYYTKNGEFGEKEVGYTDEAPGLGTNTQPTSKKATVLGGHDEVNSDSDVVKDSLVGSAKKNVQDTLSDSEAKTSNPSKVKEMEVAPKNSSGVKKMPMPGAEKKIKLQEEEIKWERQPLNENVEEQKLRSLIQQIIKEELNEGLIPSKAENIANKVIKWYENHPNPKMKELLNSVERNIEKMLSKTAGKDAISVEEFEKIVKSKYGKPFEDPNYIVFKKSNHSEKELNENKYAKSFLDAIKPAGLDINADPESSEFTDLEDAAYDFIRRSDIEDLRPEELVFAARAYAKK